MTETLKAVRITEHVYWVGAIDWAMRNFHGYKTSRGTTYNAFLILGDKITLIDTVKAPFKDELLSRISSVIDPNKIDYIVSNHSEMDHTGCLPSFIHTLKPEKVFASKMGAKALLQHFGLEDIEAVADGQTLSLGNLNLTFTETRMLHWPDSMFTYLEEDKILFSQDAFGMHLASAKRFIDEVKDWEGEAAKYYANILLPFSPMVTGLLAKVSKMNLPIEMIAPDHGPIFRKDLDRIIGLYGKWARQDPTTKAVIVFDTMWHSTAKMASAICDGLVEGGAETIVIPLDAGHRSDVAAEILDAGALIVGSPTMNNNIFPPVADVLTYLKGLKPRNIIGAAFGSYGWSGEGVKQIEEFFDAMKIEKFCDGLNVQYVPTSADLEKCRALGLQIAQRLKDIAVES
jgi:flavorubredoxin